ncbi:MAG: UvrD-helicase domain-containing protein [Defluviitaleaceae bacterium]|nr:UvrD-helicase domain-containing protein [Defluviitaleaceae bacterium]
MNLFDPISTSSSNHLLDGMNPQQKEAIEQTEGPLLILAGAGSGKTRVVTHRIAYLIEAMNVAPWQILAITFTNKAAREMKERTTKLTPYGSDVWISTFHSMCVSILRRHIDLLGYDKNFAILDDADQISALKQILKERNIDPKLRPPKYYLVRISEAKNRMRLPKDIDPELFVLDQFKEVYTDYQKMLHSNNRLDFDDLLMFTVHLFEKNPDVLAYYQQKFRYIHVDEYQDTNHAQYKIVKLLAERHRNICVVGDSDQSIYSWRGADITNILSFEKDYKEATVIKLEQNYRSTGHILDAANDVIANNPSQYDKHLFSKLGPGSKIVAKQTFSGNTEVEYVASEIKSLVNSGTSHEDIAVLYRTNAQSRLFEQQLMKENIPYRLVGGLSYFKRKEVKDLIAFLRLILDPRDDFSFERIVNVPTRGIGATTIEKVAVASVQMGMSMFHTIPTLAQSLSGATAHKLLKFHHLMTTLQAQLDTLSMTDFIDLVLNETGYSAMLKAEATIESASRIENLEEFKNMVISFEKDQLAAIISQEELEVELETMPTRQKLDILMMDIGLQTDVTEEETATEKITLMTIHASKGLEFNTVFLVGFEDGIFPLYSAIEAGEAEVEEERRLAYVAMTRAERRLYLTSARSRLHQGQTKYNKVSRFQDEIDKSRLDIQSGGFGGFASANKKPFFTTNQPMPTQPAPKVSTINLGDARAFAHGDKIMHDKLGPGVVISSDGDHVTIAFGAEHGIKKLKSGHPAIKLR